MKERFEGIDKIIDDIEKAAPNLRANLVRQVDVEMRKLEQELTAKDKEMKRVNQKIQRAMTETVDVNPLSTRIFNKYFKYIEKQVNDRKDDLLIPKSKQSLLAAQSQLQALEQ